MMTIKKILNVLLVVIFAFTLSNAAEAMPGGGAKPSKAPSRKSASSKKKNKKKSTGASSSKKSNSKKSKKSKKPVKRGAKKGKKTPAGKTVKRETTKGSSKKTVKRTKPAGKGKGKPKKTAAPKKGEPRAISTTQAPVEDDQAAASASGVTQDVDSDDNKVEKDETTSGTQTPDQVADTWSLADTAWSLFSNPHVFVPLGFGAAWLGYDLATTGGMVTLGKLSTFLATLGFNSVKNRLA